MATAWEFVAWQQICGIWATPALPVPPTLDAKPTAFLIGAHSHLCVGTGCDSCSTAAQAAAQFKAGSGEKCHFLEKTDGERNSSQQQEKSLPWLKFDRSELRASPSRCVSGPGRAAGTRTGCPSDSMHPHRLARRACKTQVQR